MDSQLNYAPCGYFSISSKGLLQSVNQTFLNMLHYERHELLDRHIESTMSVTNKMFFHTYFYPFIQLYGHVNEMYFSFRTSDHQDVPVLLNGIRQERDGEMFIDCVVVEMRKRIEHEKDILQSKTKLEELYKATNEANKKLELLHQEYETKQQELISLNHKLESLASTDPLTGLNNRRFFQESLLANIALFQRTQQPFSLFIIDIDHFKYINDNFGHPVGDLVLTQLARLLESTSREIDIVARYGGEEFVIILPNTNQEKALIAAERYRSKTENAHWGEYNITVSIGVATISQEDTEQTLLNKADQALYSSKNNGRNRITHSADLEKNIP
ncbi:diguanylate cyclase (GGDEF)-like protein/PAS domain S-box-containing protein [Paenibacillus castaneae]|uniref:sensor domain-containing diguanylate cyclase n=1 Tax=Paenibacillus castaneae TaxID=474957 RepID=UPI000C9A8A50|nr:sensor domain-containing diguanylate cyclase [Paenibacillus castaneae]NIK77752.1 diguanylate cyclase (GGDEF)-like protein/PAS domain S-box-containing protein [Paenibacillus castaneae]